MRLIYAEALIRTVRYLTLRDGEEIEIHYVEAERIDSAPTIDAVPITFIWDFMDHIEEEIAQTDDSDPRMEGLCARHNALNALLRAWKEEGQE